MAISFRSLRVNQVVDLQMKGSASHGNSGYMLSNQEVTNINEAEQTIEFSGDFEIYFFQNRWRYGSSAEVVKLVRVH